MAKGKHFRPRRTLLSRVLTATGSEHPADPERRRFLTSSAAVALSIIGYSVLTHNDEEPAYGDETYG